MIHCVVCAIKLSIKFGISIISKFLQQARRQRQIRHNAMKGKPMKNHMERNPLLIIRHFRSRLHTANMENSTNTYNWSQIWKRTI